MSVQWVCVLEMWNICIEKLLDFLGGILRALIQCGINVFVYTYFYYIIELILIFRVFF